MCTMHAYTIANRIEQNWTVYCELWLTVWQFAYFRNQIRYKIDIYTQTKEENQIFSITPPLVLNVCYLIEYSHLWFCERFRLQDFVQIFCIVYLQSVNIILENNLTLLKYINHRNLFCKRFCKSVNFKLIQAIY